MQTRIVAIGGTEPEGEHAAEAGHRAKSQARALLSYVGLLAVSISVITGKKTS